MDGHAQLINQLAISGALIAGITFVHGLFIAAGAGALRANESQKRGVPRMFRDAIALVLLTIWLMTAHGIGIWLWAGVFLRLEAFGDFETALYFAAVSYTTLGFGDVLLPEEWRLLSGAAAANGLLLFGLSAAFLVEVSAKLRLTGK
ncbi:MAG: potassium channel family protein [Amphiplicatus sp.]